MSVTYTPTTNFGAKDSLPANDPDKVIKGAEFTTEFTAIQSAFSSAAPTASPTFTGTATFEDVTADLVTAEQAAVGATGLTVLGTTTASGAINANGGITATNVTATGTSTLSTVDINGGAIDGTTIGATTPAYGEFIEVRASTSVLGALSASSASFTGDLTVDTNTLYVDATNNRVGVGTSIPDKALDVLVGASNTDVAAFSGSATGRGLVISTFDDTGTNADAGVDFDAISANGVLSFSTGTTKRLRIDSSGNVGIGTSSPVDLLHVSAGASSITPRGETVALVEGSTDTAITIASGATSTGNLFFGRNGGNYAGRVVYDHNANDMTLVANNIEAVTIDSSGNVGIGASTPDTRLTLGPAIKIFTSSLSNAVTISATATSTYQNYVEHGDVGLEFNNNSASRGYAWSINSSEKMRIDSSGNLLVGTTQGLGVGVNDNGIQVYTGSGNGQIRCAKTVSGTVGAIANYHQGTYVGGVNYSDTATSFPTSSDVRLKENIQDADSSGSVIDAIQVRQYDWKADGSHQRYGFVAQELDLVYPEAVSKGETEEDTWGVDYSKLVPLLVKEIQELKAELEALKNA